MNTNYSKYSNKRKSNPESQTNKPEVMNPEIDIDTVDVPKDEYVVVDCPALNVRSEPDTNSEVLKVVYKDQKLKKIEVVNRQWVKVEIDTNIVGYVMLEFVK